MLGSLRVERVLEGLDALSSRARESSDEPGVHRVAYSAEDMAARRWLRDQAEAAGLIAEIDALGNVFAWTETPSPGRPGVVTGSHLDSVPQGGNYDGALGALCALEVVRTFRECGASGPAPFGAIAFATEESSRFGMGAIGSRALVGDLEGRSLATLTDKEGQSLLEVLRCTGLAPAEFSMPLRSPGWAKAFLEVHIDQGRELLDAGVPIGIVTAIAAPVRYRITLLGETMHSGAATMLARRDALAGAAEVILVVEQVGRNYAGEGVVATVGQVGIQPGLITAVPGQAELGIDIRGPSRDLLDRAWNEIWTRANQAVERRHLSLSSQLLWESTPVTVDPSVVGLLTETCTSLRVPFKTTISGSGHDAMYLARQMEMGMVLVRNRGGVSHNPGEYCDPEDIALAMQVLAQTLWRMANN